MIEENLGHNEKSYSPFEVAEESESVQELSMAEVVFGVTYSLLSNKNSLHMTQ